MDQFGVIAKIMKKLFLQLLFGNLASKVLLIGADGLAVLALPSDAFGAFALLQGLILSGAVITAWGSDQAVINIVGRSKPGTHDVLGYLFATRRKVAISGVLVASVLAAIAIGSRVEFTPQTLLIVAVITMVEAQLVVNAAFFRASSRPYLAVFLFDGMRHFALFVGAVFVYAVDGRYETLLYFWLGSTVISFVVGWNAGQRYLRDRGSQQIPDHDRRHADEISRFSGLWSVMQSVISRVVLVFSAYLLAPDDLGTVAFFLKLMVVFTFLQTVTIQAVAPFIGQVSKTSNREQAQRIYRLTTFLLAATAAPLIGASLLGIDWINDAFGIAYQGSWPAVTVLLLAQALNIGTGIIGQFIIHFGYARDLLIISVIGAGAQCALLVVLGSQFGVPGVLLSYAASNLLLVILKNVLGARKIGIHGFSAPNLLIIAVIAIEVLLIQWMHGLREVDLRWLLVGHAVFSVMLVATAATRLPEITSWLSARRGKSA